MKGVSVKNAPRQKNPPCYILLSLFPTVCLVRIEPKAFPLIGISTAAEILQVLVMICLKLATPGRPYLH